MRKHLGLVWELGFLRHIFCGSSIVTSAARTGPPPRDPIKAQKPARLNRTEIGEETATGWAFRPRYLKHCAFHYLGDWLDWGPETSAPKAAKPGFQWTKEKQTTLQQAVCSKHQPLVQKLRSQDCQPRHDKRWEQLLRCQLWPQIYCFNGSGHRLRRSPDLALEHRHRSPLPPPPLCARSLLRLNCTNGKHPSNAAGILTSLGSLYMPLL